jgi:hypothetical protein
MNTHTLRQDLLPALGLGISTNGRDAAPPNQSKHHSTLEFKPMDTKISEQVAAAQKVAVEALYGFFNTGLRLAKSSSH